jgi:hypothetical protein
MKRKCVIVRKTHLQLWRWVSTGLRTRVSLPTSPAHETRRKGWALDIGHHSIEQHVPRHLWADFAKVFSMSTTYVENNILRALKEANRDQGQLSTSIADGLPEGTGVGR